jgi:hypothetical protein
MGMPGRATMVRCLPAGGARGIFHLDWNFIHASVLE